MTMIKKIVLWLLTRQTLHDVLPVALVVGSLLNGFHYACNGLTRPQLVFHYLLPCWVASYGVVKTRYQQLKECSHDN